MKCAKITRTVDGKQKPFGRVCVKDDGKPVTLYGEVDGIKALYQRVYSKNYEVCNAWVNSSGENGWKVTIFKNTSEDVQDSYLPYDYAKLFREKLQINLNDYVIVRRQLSRRAYAVNYLQLLKTDVFESECLYRYRRFKDMMYDYYAIYAGCGEVEDFILIPYAYMKNVPRKVKSHWGDEEIVVDDLLFYDMDGKVVFTIKATGMNHAVDDVYPYDKCLATSRTYKTAKYIMKNDLPVMQDLGCIDCDNSEYHICNGVYLRCTQCGKEVKEIEYDGTYYPDYCPRSVAKKIRKFTDMLKGVKA